VPELRNTANGRLLEVYAEFQQLEKKDIPELIIWEQYLVYAVSLE
jgi:uncharacterized membrane protein